MPPLSNKKMSIREIGSLAGIAGPEINDLMKLQRIP